MKKKVFIAEDAPSIARIYKQAFIKSGYSVEVVSDGEEAIAALASAKKAPDIILLDIMMPKASGFEVLEKIKKPGSALRHVPVFACTNLASLPNGETDLKRAGAMGAKEVIIKSQLDPQELVKKVADIIGH